MHRWELALTNRSMSDSGPPGRNDRVNNDGRDKADRKDIAEQTKSEKRKDRKVTFAKEDSVYLVLSGQVSL